MNNIFSEFAVKLVAPLVIANLCHYRTSFVHFASLTRPCGGSQLRKYRGYGGQLRHSGLDGARDAKVQGMFVESRFHELVRAGGVPLLILGLFVSLPATAPAAVLPPDKAPVAVWSAAGVPGGIPNRTNVYTTLSPGITASQLQTAINSCPSGKVVMLAAGTYNLSAISLGSPGPQGWTLRGAGMGKTILNITGGSACWTMGSYPPWNGSWSSSVSVDSGGTQGSTNITVSSAAAYVVGDLCVIDMANSGWIVGYGCGGSGGQVSNGDSAGKNRDGQRVQLHVAKIMAKSGNTLTFWPPLPYALDSARAPQISRASTFPGPRDAGIEDLTLNFNGTGASGIQWNGSFGCWMKNVEVKNWGTFGIWPRWSACFEMRGCYIHEPNTFDWSKGYGLQMDPCSGSLVVDNIFYKCQEEFLLQSGCAGNVIAYNFIAYSHNGYIGPNWLLQEMAINHTPFPTHNLFEGNYTGKIQADYYYGPSGNGVILRNRVTGNGPEINENRVTISIDAMQRNYSVIGNQLGEVTAPSSVTLAKPGVTISYAQPGTLAWGYDPGSSSFGYNSAYIYRLGYPFSGNNGTGSGTAVHDADVKNNTIRHGNWDAANKKVMWNSSIQDTNIPNSYFLGGKPGWFGDLAWPPYGPSAPTSTTNDIAKIPAGYRLLYNVNPPGITGGSGSGTIIPPSAPEGLRIISQ
jgi:hypothetical protein